MRLATVHAEKLRVSRYFLILFAAFGVIAAAMDYSTGNYPVVIAGLAAAVLCPLALYLSRSERYANLPRHFALFFVTALFLAGVFHQLHRGANLVWVPIFPFGYFYLAGIRTGGKLSAASFVILVVAYIAYPRLHTESRVPLDTFLQVVSAFGFTSLFAYLYERARDRQERRRLQQAEYDFLTGIPNRRGLMRFMDAQLYLGTRKNRPFSLVLLDLDDFKNVNDAHGHDVGDEALKAFAKRVQEQLRRSDLLGRWGGEEFAVVLPDEILAGAVAVAEKLRRHVAEQPFAPVGQITASFGVAEYVPGENVALLIKRADSALYRAKHGGKNRTEAEPGAVTPPSSSAAN